MNPKTLFVSTFSLFASSLCLLAQQSYEHCTVTFYNQLGTTYIGVSTGDNYTEYKSSSKFDAKIKGADLSPLLEKINELTTESREVYNTTATQADVNTFRYVYYLRRKKP